jgi:uncharacterized protein (TIGR02265 family)
MSTSQFAIEHKVKQSAFEALLKGLDVYKEAATWPELRPIYNLDYLQKTYPAQTYCQFWELVQAKIYPETPIEQAQLEMGKKLMLGYMYGTKIGRLAFSIIPLLTPDNFFKIAPQLWDHGLGEYRVEKSSAKKVVGRFSQCVLPPLALAGSTIVIMQLTKAQNFSYVVEHSTSSGGYYNFELAFEWE